MKLFHKKTYQKKLKRLLSTLMVLMMLLSLFPANALAEAGSHLAASYTKAIDGAAVAYVTTPTTVEIDLSEATENISITEGGNYVITGVTTSTIVSIDTAGTVNLTLDNAAILRPADAATNANAFSVEGGAVVNLTVKAGTDNTISNEKGPGFRIGNGELNIKGTGTLNIIGSSYPIYSSGDITIDEADVTVTNTTGVNTSNGFYLTKGGEATSGPTLTVNSGSLNVALQEKVGAGTSAALMISGSGTSFIQNGGTVTLINATSVDQSYGIRSDGPVTVKVGSLFTYGQTNGVYLAKDSTMSIKDNASFIAASGNRASFDVMKGAVFCNGTGKFIDGKGIVSLKLDSPVESSTQLALNHDPGTGYVRDMAANLPMAAYYVAFAGKLGDTYYMQAGDKYVTSESEGLYCATFKVDSIVANPVKKDAAVSSLPQSFEVSQPAGVESLKVGSAVPLSVSPNYVVNWSSSNPGVATVDDSGVVAAKSAGTATITAECLGITGTYNITTVNMTDPRVFTFIVDNPEAIVKIFRDGFTYVPVSVSGGTFTYSLEDGTYNYEVSKEGFPTITGEFTVSENGTNEISLSMYYSVDFEIIAGEGVDSAAGALIKVFDSENNEVSGTEGHFDGLNGDYTYTVTLDGCYPASGAFGGVGVIRIILNKDRSSSGAAGWAGAYNHKDGNAIINSPLPVSAGEAIEKWATQISSTDNFGAAYAGSFVVADGYVYLTGDGYLNKIDKETGEIKAQVTAGTAGYMYDYLAYGDGVLFLAGSSYITAFEAGTLKELWRTTVGGQHSTQVNGSLNSKGTVGNFRPIVYSDGYIFCGKNAFKTTSFEVDENGRNKPAWSLNDDFNWNSGTVVGDNYYVAAVQTLYAVKYKTGEVISTWEFSSDNNIYTWGGVAYSKDTGRLYFASYSGAKLYAVKLDAQGKLITNTGGTADRPVITDVSQESLCTPVIYNDRVYLTGQKGKVDVLKATPVKPSGSSSYTLETIYTIDSGEKVKVQSTPILSTAYANEGNSHKVYLYFQGYSEPAPVYVLEDSAAVTTADDAKISKVAVPSISQFAFEQIAADNDGNLYLFNESGYLFCFGVAEDIIVNVRIEGIDGNLYNGSVTVPNTGDVTAYDVLNYLDEHEDSLSITFADTSFGKYISAINGEEQAHFGGYDGWNYRVNGILPNVGVSDYNVEGNDELLLYYGDANCLYPTVDTSQLNSSGIITFTASGTQWVEQDGDTVEVPYTVPISEATVTWDDVTYTTDENGRVQIESAHLTDGDHSLQIEKYHANGLPLVVRLAPDYKVTFSTSDDITVTFRLIGDTVHEDGQPRFDGYINWIKTKAYTMDKGSKMYDLFMMAIEDAGLSQEGAEDNYVAGITAPAVLKGYWLYAFDNGPKSGWMYTVNGIHSNVGLKQQTLADGDQVIWHYINDYEQETSYNGSNPPYLNSWLNAPDIDPVAEKAVKNISIRIEGPDVTLLPKTTLDSIEYFNPQSFGGTDNGKVTALHALVKGIEEGAGADPVDKSILDVSSGLIKSIFGQENDTYGVSWMYAVNNEMPSTDLISQYELQEGDSVVVFCVDWIYGYHSMFDREEATVKTGEKLNLTLTGENIANWMFGQSTGPEAIEGAELYISGDGEVNAGNSTGIFTGQDGTAEISFDEPGEYLISAVRFNEDDDEVIDISRPYCKVTVEPMTGFTVERTDDGEFSNGEDANVTVQMTNNNDLPQQATLIICLYDITEGKNEMINYAYASKEVASGETVRLSGGFAIPDTGTYKIKVFVWDTFDVMKQLAEPILIDVDN
ncbi:bacterial Ig-like domain (group 2) [Oxobacter pfennigii]|uniref:Bacterial Ig-like domain (Group 2) n=1 Tax=Oxobacter pfennigii TaxID=36849 RepID=A0A0P8W6H8_9CLOT|nr:DUF4430 domain-containing protein [Oxobacter pfennigii]KPU43346.1 bacterial Ig-like domain (group 2) [Oxobacter pfennigii]